MNSRTAADLHPDSRTIVASIAPGWPHPGAPDRDIDPAHTGVARIGPDTGEPLARSRAAAPRQRGGDARASRLDQAEASRTLCSCCTGIAPTDSTGGPSWCGTDSSCSRGLRHSAGRGVNDPRRQDRGRDGPCGTIVTQAPCVFFRILRPPRWSSSHAVRDTRADHHQVSGVGAELAHPSRSIWARMPLGPARAADGVNDPLMARWGQGPGTRVGSFTPSSLVRHAQRHVSARRQTAPPALAVGSNRRHVKCLQARHRHG